MSGHSKWSQIKRQKGAADVKRGQLFSKLTVPIILAAKNGGDPEANFQLKMAIEKARAANMPKENIDRAILRGSGKAGGAQIEEVLYEAIGPGGIAIIIETATDNRNRTAASVKNVLQKFAGKLTGSGAATYQFTRMGKLLIDLEGSDKEKIELAIIDSGAEDFEEQDDVLAVYTLPAELERIKKSLESQGLTINEAVLSWEPKAIVTVADSTLSPKIIDMMENLEELDDVVAVYSNFDLPVGEASIPKELIR